ncbi:hypothetical protein ABPG72_006287 [Tetrahymena utriculariae]
MKSIRKKWKQGKFQKIQNVFQNNNQNVEDQDEEDIEEESQLNLQQRLQSQLNKTKDLALITLANISHGSPQDIINICIEQPILLQLITILDDNSPFTVIHDLNAITNLLGLEYYTKESMGQQLNISSFLLEKSLLVKLEKLIITVKNHLSLQTISNDDKLQSLKILQTIYELLTCLIENVQERYLKLVTDSPLSQVFIRTAFEIISQIQDFDLLATILSYIQVLTEVSGQVCILVIENHELMEVFAKILRSNNLNDLKFKSQVVSILYNVLTTCDNRLNEEFQVVLTTMCDFIVQTMSIKIFQEVSNLQSIMSNNISGLLSQIKNDENLDENENEQEEVHDKELEDQKSKEAIRIWFSTAEAIEIIMGVLVNLFEKESEEDVFEDEEMNSDCDDEVEEQKISNGNTVQIKENGKFVENQVKQFMINQLLKPIFLEMVVEKSLIVSKEVINFFDQYGQSGQSILAQINTVINFSLSILTNWIYNYSTYLNNEWNTIVLPQVWEDLKRKLTTLQNTTHLNQIIVLNLKLFFQIIKQNQDLSAQINCSEILSISKDIFSVECQELTLVYLDLIAYRFHPKFKISQEENSNSCLVLKDLLNSEDPMIASQALNTLFDIYSEEDYDNIFVQHNMLQILITGKDIFQSKINQFKQNLNKSDYDFIKETLVNLKRFIKYKQQHIK